MLINKRKACKSQKCEGEIKNTKKKKKKKTEQIGFPNSGERGKLRIRSMTNASSSSATELVDTTF